MSISYKDFARLHDEITPYCFAKKKSDSDVDFAMPELLNVRQVQEMDPELAEYYEYGRQEALKALANVGDRAKLTISDRGHILAAITHMRQMVITPEVKYPEYRGPTPRIDAAVEKIGAHLQNSPGHPIIVFSDYKKPFHVLRRKLAEELGLREDEIGEISGGMSKEDRDDVRKRLNSGKIKVGMISIKAGGYGLNLQGAPNKVLFLHKPWTPAGVEQSIARVWRQGQKEKVMAIHLHMRNTIEDHIERLLHTKKGLSAAVLEGEEGLAEGGKRLRFEDYMALSGVTEQELKRYMGAQKGEGRRRTVEGARKSLWLPIAFLRRIRQPRRASA